jgi:hypothetical protein
METISLLLLAFFGGIIVFGVMKSRKSERKGTRARSQG